MDRKILNIVRKIVDPSYSVFGKYKKNYIQELVYAETFHDSIKGCEWLDDSKFAISPGRWAVGYNYLYIAFRVLDEIRPQSILEFGMGQSTKLISQYVNNVGKSTYHICVEENKSWAEIFGQRFDVSNSDIKVIDTVMEHYPDNKAPIVRRFDKAKLSDAIYAKKFDFISIDGPIGSNKDSRALSRSDILDYIPECLSSSFVIIMDDYERDEERNTSREIRRVLTENDIEWEYGLYLGESMVNVICSKDLAYLCSL